jgi:choline-glycine betaine transporter
VVWFGILGGTTMLFESEGRGISDAGSSEAILFAVLQELPFGVILSVLAMISIILFFVTSADSEQVDEWMDRFISTVQENWYIWTPTELAAYTLWRMNWIHPFTEGNGRTARAAIHRS